MSTPRSRAALARWLAAAAARDPAVLEAALGPDAGGIEESGLDMRTHALVRLAALVAASEPGTTYDEHVTTALDQGVTPDEILGVLVALLGAVGTPRLRTAATGVLDALDRATADIPADPPARQA